MDPAYLLRVEDDVVAVLANAMAEAGWTRLLAWPNAGQRFADALVQQLPQVKRFALEHLDGLVATHKHRHLAYWNMWRQFSQTPHSAPAWISMVRVWATLQPSSGWFQKGKGDLHGALTVTFCFQRRWSASSAS